MLGSEDRRMEGGQEETRDRSYQSLTGRPRRAGGSMMLAGLVFLGGLAGLPGKILDYGES